jgi:single-stranded DNA-binding protein
MQKLTLIGNIGKDATIATNKNTGEEFASFDLAVNYNDKTTWYKVNVSSSHAKIFEHLKKGTKLYIEGYPTVNAYVNKNNEAVASIVCNVKELHFLGSSENKQAKAVDKTDTTEAPTL